MRLVVGISFSLCPDSGPERAKRAEEITGNQPELRRDIKGRSARLVL
jgi:hypothetical protein